MKKFVLVLVALVTIVMASPATAAAAEPVRTIELVSALPDRPGLLVRTVNLWNYNPTTRLVIVPACSGTVQCATISVGAMSQPNRIGEASPWEGYARVLPFTWENGDRKTLRTVLCHEVGHLLGLGHTEQGCMHTYAGDDQTKPGPYNRSIVPAELINDWVY